MLNDQNVSVLVKQKQKLFIDAANYIYLIPTFIKYLLSIYYVLGTMLSTEDAAVNKKQKCPHTTSILVEGERQTK